MWSSTTENTPIGSRSPAPRRRARDHLGWAMDCLDGLLDVEMGIEGPGHLTAKSPERRIDGHSQVSNAQLWPSSG